MLRNSTIYCLLELLCALSLPFAVLATEQGGVSNPLPGSPRTHITIDEDRFGRTSKAPNPTRAVTRRSYLDTISRFHSHFAKPKLLWLTQYKPYPNLAVNIEVTLYFAFRYHVTGETLHAERAVEFIADAHELSRATKNGEPTATLIRIHRIWQWLEGSAAFTDEAKRQLGDIILVDRDHFPADRIEYGNSNRPFGFAVDGQILLRYAPNANDRDKWQTFIDETWTKFFEAGDIRENAAHYESLSLSYLIEWADIRDATAELQANPAFQTMVERYLQQVLPIGSLPHYGDSHGWNVNWGTWIHIFEFAAAHSRDGRFRWAAHRLFVYSLLHIENISSWSYTGNHAIQSVMRAALVADDGIAPIEPTASLSVGWRAGIAPAPSGAPANRGPFRVVPERRIPAKVQMLSGASPDATALQLELVPEAGHGASAVTNLVAFTDRGSVLLMDQGYMERERQFHNVLLLEDYEGIPLNPEKETVELIHATDTGPMVYAKLRVENYMGYPADLERVVVFAKAGAVLIVDTLQFRETLRVRAGPVYNLGALGPETGTGHGTSETWVNGYLGDSIAVKGVGAGQPVYARWKNPPRDLLLYFRPMKGAEVFVHDRRPKDATTPLPLRVQYRWRGTLRAGESLSTSTVLLPHTPTRVPSRLAAEIFFAADTGSSTAVSVPTETGDQVWLVAGPVETGSIRSDAYAAVVVLTDGTVTRAGAAGGSRLEIGGREVGGVIRGNPKAEAMQPTQPPTQPPPAQPPAAAHTPSSP